MNLMGAIEQSGRLPPLALPELRYLHAAAERVRERWPDVQVKATENEREALAQKLRYRVESDEWDDARLSFMVSAAAAVFDAERRERPELARTRDFLYTEITASTSETLLAGLLRAYLESYVSKGVHTIALSTALGESVSRMSAGGRLLLEAIPELMDPSSGPERLAGRMSKMSDPYAGLLRLGIRNPHSSGFMELAHGSLTELIRPQLSERIWIDWYIKWLRPTGKDEARTIGAESSIEALIHPWLENTPDDKLRSYLVETLIELYGDPRIKSGGVWGGIGERYMAIVHRWLTREDMRFFTGVVDATQKDAMWPPRRDFWLKLYDEGLIDAAWAALSTQAFEYARQHLMRQNAQNAYTRVGFQQARQNTSLLIMKIGNKIMVDGCHSYRTHVFDIGDPMAPKLFQEGYHCDEIMRASDRRASGASKSHSSIPSWSRWVRDMINADVPWSRQDRPYTKVFRPRPPQQRYVPTRQPEMPRYPNRDNSMQDVRVSTSGQGLPSPRGSTRSFFDSGVKSSTNRFGESPSRGAASALEQTEVTKSPNPSPVDAASLKETRFPNLTDRMIAYGPRAAQAVLAYLEAPPDGRTRPLLSPKSREGLAWVRAVKGDPPLRLRNALEYLLISLKSGGVDLDDLFASQKEPAPSVLTDKSRQSVRSIDRGTDSLVTGANIGRDLLDLLVQSGPAGASALLSHLLNYDPGKAKRLLSETSRATLERMSIKKILLSRDQENALIFLLRTMQTVGHRPFEIINNAVSGTSAPKSGTLESSAPQGRGQSEANTDSAEEKSIYLKDINESHVTQMRMHVDALDGLGRQQHTFEQRKNAANAVMKLRWGKDLEQQELQELERLYEQLARQEKGGTE